MSLRWVRDPWKRRSLVVVGVVVLAVFSIWPRMYVAKAALMPEDNSGGLASILSGAGGSLASLGSLIGGRQSIEADLTIARSVAVAVDAAGRLKREGLIKGSGTQGNDIDQAAAALRKRVVVEAIRGNILQISISDRDPAFAKAAVSDFADALRSRLQSLDVTQTGQKKDIAANRMAEATSELARAQSALDQFRMANRLAAPEIELGAAISLVTGLQARLQAEESQLAALEKFATGDNIQVQAARSQIDAIKGQIAKAQASASANVGPTVGGMSPKISEYENLYRAEKYAEAEYDVYKRYLDTVTVEQLSSSITMNMEEPPYIDPDRQFNTHAVAALTLLLLAAFLAEFYLAQPPPGWATREAK